MKQQINACQTKGDYAPACYIVIWNNLTKSEVAAIANRETRELTYTLEPNIPTELEPEPIITDRYARINGKTFNVEKRPDEKLYVTSRRNMP